MVQGAANGGRDSRDRREGDETIDQTGDAIGRQIASSMAARGARHHRQNHRADRPRRQGVDGGALRQIGIEHRETEQGGAHRQPGIADMENEEQRLGRRRAAAPAQQAPEVERRTEQQGGGRSDEKPERTPSRTGRHAGRRARPGRSRPWTAGRSAPGRLASQLRVKLGTIRPATTEISTITAASARRHPSPEGTATPSASRCIRRLAMPRTVTGATIGRLRQF